MKNSIKKILKPIFEKLPAVTHIEDTEKWREREYAAPSPPHIKQAVLLRNGIPNATWVETGTYLGDTTSVLSRQAKMVYSIEPEPDLFNKAQTRFANTTNIQIFNGTSETVFPALLPSITSNINFWLDGHYSAGITFKGSQDTPIRDELRCISENTNHFGKLCVLVDDVRCFDPRQPAYSTYPTLDFLVDWARASHLHWHIEHDIFIAKNY